MRQLMKSIGKPVSATATSAWRRCNASQRPLRRGFASTIVRWRASTVPERLLGRAAEVFSVLFARRTCWHCLEPHLGDHRVGEADQVPVVDHDGGPWQGSADRRG